ncbi:MAG TPA: hypothetical protein VGH28_06000 [Polyangiaceae bacterium]
MLTLAAVGCDKKDSAATATASASASAAAAPSASAAPTASATAAETAAATTTATTEAFEPGDTEWFGLQKQMMGSYDHFSTCAKLAADLERWNTDNRAYLEKFRAWAHQNPDKAKAFKKTSLETHKADMADWPRKIRPAQKCQSDPKVIAALKDINQE